MTRSKSASPSGLNSPFTSCQVGGAPPKNCSTLRRAISAKSGLRSNETRVPCSPTARSSQQLSAPEPAPASSTRAPGNTSANATI
jgi:hypothetical protein